MTSLADLTYGDDELDSADMKPWWEDVVTYCNQLLFSCSFVTLFLIDFREELDAKCVPKDLNSTPPFREDFVDTYCHNQLYILTRYPGAGGLMGSVWAYLLCTGWTYPGPMRNAFRALKKVDKLLDDNRITENDLNRPRSNHEALTDNKKDAINFASEYLKKYIKFHDKTLLIIYMVVMVLRLGLFAFAVFKIYSTFLCQSDEAIESYFLCDVKLNDEIWQVYCTGDILLRGYVFGICIIMIAVIMLLCSVWGTIIAISVCCGCRYNDFIVSELSQDERRSISRKTRHGAGLRQGRSIDRSVGDNTLFLKEFCIKSTTVSPALVRLINQVVKSETTVDYQEH